MKPGELLMYSLSEYLKKQKGWGCGGRASPKQPVTD
jgi:hypothetical protein